MIVSCNVSSRHKDVDPTLINPEHDLVQLTQFDIELQDGEGQTGRGVVHSFSADVSDLRSAMDTVSQDILHLLPIALVDLRSRLEIVQASMQPGRHWDAFSAALTAVWGLDPARPEAASESNAKLVASGIYLGASEDQAAREAAKWKRSGLTAGKLRVGREVTTDLRVIEAVRAEVGDHFELMADCTWGWSAHEAAARLRLYEPYHFVWFESPIARATARDLAALRGQGIGPIGSGDKTYGLAGIQELLETNAVDVLVVDPTKSGGAYAMIEALKMAERYGVPRATHSYPRLSMEIVSTLKGDTWVDQSPTVDA